MKNKITFCCSTYNTLNYLKLAIKSVRQNAHFKDAPFVVHTENSDDGTNEWLEENKDKYNLEFYIAVLVFNVFSTRKLSTYFRIRNAC